MNVAIIGSGGREHAICQKLREDNKKLNIFCIPGNAGTSLIAKNIEVDFLKFSKLYKVLKNLKVKMVIVGPEEPLVKGVVDYLNERKINAIGPNRFAAKLEGSKGFLKNLCKKQNIPTASFKICKDFSEVNKFIKKNKFPVVVKADGIAAGKGVKICKTLREVKNFSEAIFNGKFKSSSKVIMESFLTGEEASYFIIVDKYNFKFFGTAQDHKRVGEGDKGPNTGGMGAYSPANNITKEVEKIINRIIKPTIQYLNKKKKYFKGFLYAGLMIKNNDPYLIEYNVRMGDPECQVILPRLKLIY